MPEEAKKCVASWKKYCPDYEVVRWDETNFDLRCNRYVQEAYQAKKWAFVSDYVRLWVLVNYGGIYMDTDVEVLKPLDGFLGHRAFSGFESDSSVPTGIMACEKGFPLFYELLDDYSNRAFISPDGSYDLSTNVVAITKTCRAHGLQLNNALQVIDGFVLYPSDWFCPKSHETGLINLTDNSVTIHHFSGSWIDDIEKKMLQERRDFLNRHPYWNPMAAGLLMRVRHAIKTGNSGPLRDALRLYFRNRS